MEDKRWPKDGSIPPSLVDAIFGNVERTGLMLIKDAKARARALYLATLAEACQTAFGWVADLSQRCDDCLMLGAVCPNCHDIETALPALQKVIDEARNAWNKAERL